MNKSKITVVLLTMLLGIGSVVTGCDKKAGSIMPIVDITMKSKNDELKDAYGDKYDDLDYEEGVTTIKTTAAEADVTIHIEWEDDSIKNIWMEAATTKDNYEGFEKLITDFYPDLQIEKQADVIENGMTTYQGKEISYTHFIEQGNVFLYVSIDETEEE